LGDEFLTEVTAALAQIGSNPQSFSRLESYTGAHEIRRRFAPFSYLIVFACRPNEALVVAIAHVRRRPLFWMERLGTV
jgi:hypothetical protein